MGIKHDLKEFVWKSFKTTLRVFLNALKLSPNAQGYVRGSITELLLLNELRRMGYTVERIKEKWEGKKHPNHHGDFYIKTAEPVKWIVLECKGIKSNTEKWHKLYNYDKLVKFFFEHYEMIPWINNKQEIEPQIRRWIRHNLPLFMSEYKMNLYEYEEVNKYKVPQKPTSKSRSIERLVGKSREEISELIDKRIDYLLGSVGVLETHFVAGKGTGNRSQATPRKDEFNLIAVDIYLRYDAHLFLYANPSNLESSGADPDHLQQNYVIGFVFRNNIGEKECNFSDEFTESFEEAYNSVSLDEAVDDGDRQVDIRNAF